MEELKVKVSTCFDRLQNLQIAPTLRNMEILLQTLYDLREIYNELKARETDGTEDRATSDSDGRNSN